MENYEEKYKNALEWARQVMAGRTGFVRTEVEDVFPELKESKDEKIRKAILIYLDWLDGRNDYAPRGEYSIREMIDWLKKQESVGAIVERCKTSWYNEGKIQGQIEGLSDDEKYQQGWHDALEKQGEQKSQRMISAESKETLYNKNKPKFKVGDWVYHNKAEFVYMIKTIGRDGYGVISRDGQKSVVNYSAEINYHLWSIADAKDGDVLVSKYKKPFIYNGNHNHLHIGFYCGISVEDRVNVSSIGCCCWTENVNIHPATKEQREFLFQKMRENGYYWNYNTKTIEKY